MEKQIEIEDAVAATPAIVTEEGSYKLLEFVNITQDFAGVYNALFTKNDGSTEQRVITIQYNEVLSWHR